MQMRAAGGSLLNSSKQRVKFGDEASAQQGIKAVSGKQGQQVNNI